MLAVHLLIQSDNLQPMMPWLLRDPFILHQPVPDNG